MNQVAIDTDIFFYKSADNVALRARSPEKKTRMIQPNHAAKPHLG